MVMSILFGKQFKMQPRRVIVCLAFGLVCIIIVMGPQELSLPHTCVNAYSEESIYGEKGWVCKDLRFSFEANPSVENTFRYYVDEISEFGVLLDGLSVSVMTGSQRSDAVSVLGLASRGS
jgi:hypothetical protein